MVDYEMRNTYESSLLDMNQIPIALPIFPEPGYPLQCLVGHCKNRNKVEEGKTKMAVDELKINIIIVIII